MKKLIPAFVFIIATVVSVPFLSGAENMAASIKSIAPVEATANDSASTLSTLYDSLELNKLGLSHGAFDIALKGYEKLDAAGKIKNTKISIIDFSQPSTKKRLYVIDIAAKKLLFNTYVAHGRNSGQLMATKFSNTNHSLQSSLGFFITAEKYMGKHGLSMRMDGVEKTNSNARERAVVVHGADYVSEGFIKSTGYLGRSWGCPAINPELNEPIINAIGNGSCLFIYSPQADYVSQSSLLSN